MTTTTRSDETAPAESPRPTPPCPVCHTANRSELHRCITCGEDLAALAAVEQIVPRLHAQAVRASRDGDPDAALAAFQTVLTLAPGDVPALVGIGKLQAQQGRYDDAVASWRRALALDPANAAAQAGITRATPLLDRERRATGLRRALVAGGLAAAVLIGAGFMALARPAAPPVTAPAVAASTPASTPAPIVVTATPAGVVVAASASPTAGAAVADLAGPARTALGADPALREQPIAVRQEGAAVLLTGTVGTAAQRARAEEIVKTVPGVAAVDSSGLAVQPPRLAELARQQLAAEPRLAGTTIDVQQVGEGLRLRGQVGSLALKQMAEGAVARVTPLVDSRELTVTPPDLTAGARAALAANPRTAALTLDVEQAGGGLRLRGSVPGPIALQAVVDTVARAVPGAELVDTRGIRIEPREYTVRPGDTLASIARQEYGDEQQWGVIWDANRSVLGRPDVLTPGTRLRVPER